MKETWFTKNIVWIVLAIIFAYAIWDYYNNMQIDPFYNPGNY